VFVSVIESQDDARVSRLEGAITDIDVDNSTIALCEADEVDDPDACVPVRIGERTLLVDAMGAPVRIGALIED
jgi:hypothetical protein